MSMVVTGATGCLGMNLVKRLTNDGHEVIALGRNLQLGQLLMGMGARFVPLDLRDKRGLATVCKDAKVVFHSAALSSPWGRYNDFYQANVVGTQNVIDAIPKYARMIHVSTPSLYFDFTEKHDIKETAPLSKSPANHYVQTKRIAETLVDDACQKKGLDVITIRPRGIFGPFDRAIMPRVINSERKNGLPLIGTGKNIIDITYVDNVVESLVLAAHASQNLVGRKYNITNDEPRPLIEILTLLYDALEKPLKTKPISYSLAKKIAATLEATHRFLQLKSEPKLTRYTAAAMAMGQTLNIDAAKKELNYKPIISIEQGLQQFAQWYTS